MIGMGVADKGGRSAAGGVQPKIDLWQIQIAVAHHRPNRLQAHLAPRWQYAVASPLTAIVQAQTEERVSI